MPERTLAVLVRTDLRRAASEIRRRTILLGMAGVVVLLLTGWRSAFMALLIGGIGMSYVFQVPIDLARDRLSGDLRFLTTLPVPAGTLVGAKFLTAAILNLVGVLHWPLAVAAAPPGWWEVPLATGAASVLWGWGVLCVVSFVGIALLARFELETVLNGPFPVLLIGYLVLSRVFERWSPASLEQVRWMTSQPWFELALAASALGVGAGVSAVAFGVAARGLEAYRPEPGAGANRVSRWWARGR